MKEGMSFPTRVKTMVSKGAFFIHEKKLEGLFSVGKCKGKPVFKFDVAKQYIERNVWVVFEILQQSSYLRKIIKAYFERINTVRVRLIFIVFFR